MPSVTTTVTSSGYTTLVAAPTGTQFIVVLGFSVMSADTLTVKLTSASTDKYTVLTPAGISCPIVEGENYFQCAAAEALRVNLSGASASGVAINVTYAVLG